MRPRFSLLIALVLATVALTYAGGHIVLPVSPPDVHASLPPSSASYLGVYINGSPPDYQPIANFANVTGTKPNLVGYYSGWAQPFAQSYAQLIRSHGVIPFVQIDPTYASVPQIVAGAYDAYLRLYADSVRNFGHAVVIGFDNVTWLWTINADRPGTGRVALWWPGARYVTWVGIDGYYYTPSDTFDRVFGQTIDQVRAFTRKPVLLSETAVGPKAGQIVKIGDLFRGMRQYKALGLVWFNKAQHHGIRHQDWRLEDNPAAEAAFRLNVADLKLTRP